MIVFDILLITSFLFIALDMGYTIIFICNKNLYLDTILFINYFYSAFESIL